MKDQFTFSCPKCKKLLVGAEAIRLRSRPKLTKQMQKLLRKKREDGKKLTARQHVLLDRAMQCCNVLVMKCIPCQWQTEIKLQSREALHRHKARLRQKAEEQQTELAGAVEGDSETLDKKTLKKLKKKERKKKSAERKAQDLQLSKRLSASPIGSATDRHISMPMSSTPLPAQSLSPFPAQCSSLPAKSVAEGRKSRTFITPNMTHTPNITHTATTYKSDRLTPRSDRASLSGNLSGRTNARGKQELRKVLNQKKKTNLSANESLQQFLDSMK